MKRVRCWVCRGRGVVPGVYYAEQCPNCCERDLARPLYPDAPDEWLELAAALPRTRLRSNEEDTNG